MYPIYYMDYRKCLKCGSMSVAPCDQRGINKQMIYPVIYMKCSNCGEEFYIRWVEDLENPDKRIPVCTGKDSMNDTVKRIIYAGKADMDKRADDLKTAKK